MSYPRGSWPYNELTTASRNYKRNHFATSECSNISCTQLKPPIKTDLNPKEPQFFKSNNTHSPSEANESNTLEEENLENFHMASQVKLSNVGLVYIEEISKAKSETPTDDQRQISQLNLNKEVDTIVNRTEKCSILISPTFREEKILQNCEKLTDHEQAKDLKVKIRVRVAKFFLRSISFGCSLIVLTMVSMSFSIFNATKNLPPRNHLPAWAIGTKTWPQAFVLVTSCVSLLLCLIVFWNYFRGGHRKAEKIAVYYTLFTVTTFIFSSIIWGIAAGILQGSRTNGMNKDLWGWSCVDNKRRQLFSDRVNYALVCRMQNWVLVCCIIEIVLESITILLYAVIFYRYYTKQRLRKSMHIRDRARSELYSAQLLSHTALITPVEAPHLSQVNHKHLSLGINQACLSDTARRAPTSAISSTPFRLQPPPLRKLSSTRLKLPPNDRTNEKVLQHMDAAPDEPVYEKVSIPKSYPSSPVLHGHS